MRIVAPILCLLLVACAASEDATPAPERDPASEQALADQILVDPDLANQNEGNAALTVSSDHSLPTLIATADSAAAARADAALLVGGANEIARLAPLKERYGEEPASTAGEAAARLPGANACLGALSYSARWAAEMPAAFPVYPRAATQEAAGSDGAPCKLRVVRFVTPVEPDDVLAFYAARARAAKFAYRVARGAPALLLLGASGTSAFRLSVRLRDDGWTEATLATIA